MYIVIVKIKIYKNLIFVKIIHKKTNFNKFFAKKAAPFRAAFL